MFNIIQSALAGAKRVFEILDYEEETADQEDSLEKMKDPAGRVAFHPVSFQVKPGEVIGLLGETGTSKTTIVNLLTQFYDGQIKNYCRAGDTGWLKYYQGLAGDGSTFFEIKGSGDSQIEVRGGWFDVYADGTFHYDLTVNGALNTNTLAPRSGTRLYIGEYGCHFNNTSDGTLRLSNGDGSYLTISGSGLSFTKSNGTSVTLA